MSKIRGWQKVPNELRIHLSALKGIKLAVWLCHRLHEDKKGQSWPSLKRLAAETGYFWKRVCAARTALIRAGWIAKVGEVEMKERDADGQYKVPIIKTLTPFEASTLAQNEDACMAQFEDATLPQNAESAKGGTEVQPRYHDSQKQGVCCSEEDTEKQENESSGSSDCSLWRPKDTSQTKTKAKATTSGRWNWDSKHEEWMRVHEGFPAQVKELVSYFESEIKYGLKDVDSDIADVVGIVLCLQSKFDRRDLWSAGRDLQDLLHEALPVILKVFKSKQWKTCDQTVKELCFRLHSENEKGLWGQALRVLQGKWRTQAQKPQLPDCRSCGKPFGTCNCPCPDCGQFLCECDEAETKPKTVKFAIEDE